MNDDMITFRNYAKKEGFNTNRNKGVVNRAGRLAEAERKVQGLRNSVEIKYPNDIMNEAKCIAAFAHSGLVEEHLNVISATQNKLRRAKNQLRNAEIDLAEQKLLDAIHSGELRLIDRDDNVLVPYEEGDVMKFKAEEKKEEDPILGDLLGLLAAM